MPGIHPLLERQLTRHGILDLSAPPTVEQWYRFLERISQTYADADREHASLERELRQANDSLNKLHTDCRAAIDHLTVRVQDGVEPKDLLSLIASFRPVCEDGDKTLS